MDLTIAPIGAGGLWCSNLTVVQGGRQFAVYTRPSPGLATITYDQGFARDAYGESPCADLYVTATGRFENLPDWFDLSGAFTVHNDAAPYDDVLQVPASP